MFIIRNISEQKSLADIKHVTMVTVIAVSPDLSDSVTELAYSMVEYFTPQICISIEADNFLVYISE